MQASRAIAPLHPWGSLASLRDPVDSVLSQCSTASSNWLVQRSGARSDVCSASVSLGTWKPQRAKRILIAPQREGRIALSTAVSYTDGMQPLDDLSARGVSGKLQRAGRHQVRKQYVGDGSWVASSASELGGRWGYAAVGTAAIVSCGM